jgi:hypothetical protein
MGRLRQAYHSDQKDQVWGHLVFILGSHQILVLHSFRAVNARAWLTTYHKLGLFVDHSFFQMG